MKPRRFTLDRALGMDPPSIGDVLTGPVAIYRITSVRPVESKVWDNRWAVTMERIGTVGVPIPDALRPPPWAEWSEFRAYRRGETPTQFFGASA